MVNDDAKVRVRMYRQGLGDCFLLTFFKGGKDKEDVHILIDCGTLGRGIAGNEMETVIEDIRKTTTRQTKKSQLDLLVITHEHKDHVSGFNKSGQKIFDKFTVLNVWLPWTEDPEDDLAKKIKKHQEDLLSALLLTTQIMSKNEALDTEEKQVSALLAFSGDLGEDGRILGVGDFKETVHAAMSYASNLAQEVEVDEQGEIVEVKKIPGRKFLWPRRKVAGKPEQGPVLETKFLKGWRFYVLGPPYHEEKINRLGSKGAKELYHLSEHLAVELSANARFFDSNLPAAEYRDRPPLAEDLAARMRFDAAFPFDAYFRIEKDNNEGQNRSAYEHLSKSYKSEDWRCIDYDWLTSIEDFALQLDNSTNNASLVLAIEEVKEDGENGRVLLFPGDAQLGNWETWDGSIQETGKFKLKDTSDKEYEVEYKYPIEFTGTKVTPVDLLRRTVFYKVGHHSSHNATTRAGLEKLNAEWREKSADSASDLVAMIPVDSEVADNKGWTMPEPELLDALLKQTNGHVLRSDKGWPKEMIKNTTVDKEKRVFEDPHGKFKIEYQQNEDGSPNGLYIDYFLF